MSFNLGGFIPILFFDRGAENESHAKTMAKSHAKTMAKVYTTNLNIQDRNINP